MKFSVFGSCSGTEPMPGRHHTAFAVTLEEKNRILWFDAGENCSYTAYNMGIDLSRISDIFISHPHRDHIGGLAGLLGVIRKLSALPASAHEKSRLPAFGGLNIYMPSVTAWNGMLEMMGGMEFGKRMPYPMNMTRIRDGVLLDDGEARVTAVHNYHIPEAEDGLQSFSFKLEAEGQTVVYSGDIKSFDDLAPLLTDGCDLLMIETGHHVPAELARRAKEWDKPIGTMLYLHHGRAILYNYPEEYLKVRETFGKNVYLANDEDEYILQNHRVTKL